MTTARRFTEGTVFMGSGSRAFALGRNDALSRATVGCAASTLHPG